MSQKEDLILIGGGGHCLSCIDVIELAGRFRILGIVDGNEQIDTSILEYPLLGREDDLPRLRGYCKNFLVTVGQIKSPTPRIQIFERLKELGGTLPTIVSPLAHVSRRAVLGEGTIVMHHALVNAGAKIGCNCIINTKALIEHGAVVDDHCHISTAAVVNGGVRVERCSFIGSNAVLREAIVIGKESIVGAGATITQDIPPGSMVRSQPPRITLGAVRPSGDHWPTDPQH